MYPVIEKYREICNLCEEQKWESAGNELRKHPDILYYTRKNSKRNFYTFAVEHEQSEFLQLVTDLDENYSLTQQWYISITLDILHDIIRLRSRVLLDKLQFQFGKNILFSELRETFRQEIDNEDQVEWLKYLFRTFSDNPEFISSMKKAYRFDIEIKPYGYMTPYHFFCKNCLISKETEALSLLLETLEHKEFYQFYVSDILRREKGDFLSFDLVTKPLLIIQNRQITQILSFTKANTLLNTVVRIILRN